MSASTRRLVQFEMSLKCYKEHFLTLSVIILKPTCSQNNIHQIRIGRSVVLQMLRFYDSFYQFNDQIKINELTVL